MIPLIPVLTATASLLGALAAAGPALQGTWDGHKNAKLQRKQAERDQRIAEIEKIIEVTILTGPTIVKVLIEAPGRLAQARINKYARRMAQHLGKAAQARTLLAAEQDSIDHTDEDQAKRIAKLRRKVAEHQAKADDYNTRLQALHTCVITNEDVGVQSSGADDLPVVLA